MLPSAIPCIPLVPVGVTFEARFWFWGVEQAVINPPAAEEIIIRVSPRKRFLIEISCIGFIHLGFTKIFCPYYFEPSLPLEGQGRSQSNWAGSCSGGTGRY